MGIRVSGSSTLPLGGRWVVDVETTDDDGQAVDGAPVLTVTDPAGVASAPLAAPTSTGTYRAFVLVDQVGRWLVRAVSATSGAAAGAAYVLAATDGAGMPDAGDLVDYMGPTSHTPEQLGGALAAEAAAQRACCSVGAEYPADLRDALLRRAQRNLAMRRLPLALAVGDAEAGSASVMPPGQDPEVRRLERPWRRMPVG